MVEQMPIRCALQQDIIEEEEIEESDDESGENVDMSEQSWVEPENADES